jgi:hypothetical protein
MDAKQVYCDGAPCEIVGGNNDEYWAAVRFEDGTVSDVDLGRLKAEGGLGTIKEAIAAVEETRHVPVSVSVTDSGYRMRLTSSVEFEFRFDEGAEKSEVIDSARNGFAFLKLAFEQPRRLLWRVENDQLADWEQGMRR